MAKPQHVVEIPLQPPAQRRDGEPVLHVELPREVTDPGAFEDVELVAAGDREVVPTGLASLSDVLRDGLGLLPLVTGFARVRRRDRSGAAPVAK